MGDLNEGIREVCYMITIINTGLGNVKSIFNMLSKIGVAAEISGDPSAIARAEKLILPGVGSFDAGVEQLHSLGLFDLLNEKILEDKIPILGICLGAQLFAKSSEEGSKAGLGWINAEVKKFDFSGLGGQCKIPHIGWNFILPNKEHVIFKNIVTPMKYYFVHSYHYLCEDESLVLATASHGYDFACVIVQNNILGVQFHPEKSHRYGMQMLSNFASI